MAPDEVLRSLEKIGIRLSRVSLTRYGHQKLIPDPVRENRGGPGGCYVDYPPETVFHAYAAYCLLNGEWVRGDMQRLFNDKVPKLTPDSVANIRFLCDFLSTNDAIRDASIDSSAYLNQEREKLAANFMELALRFVWMDLVEEAQERLRQVS